MANTPLKVWWVPQRILPQKIAAELALPEATSVEKHDACLDQMA